MTPEAKSTLSKTIRALRARLLEDLEQAVRRRYRLQVRAHEAGLDAGRQAERKRLEDWLEEQVRAQPEQGKGEGERQKDDFLGEVVKEAAYTFLNRMVLLRLMEEAELVSPPVLSGGWESRGYREFCDWAPALLDDETQGYQTLLGLVFDELSHDLPGLFGRVGLTELIAVPPATLRAVVEALNQPELQTCWSDDTTFGWVYQYWNDPEREELDDKLNSGGKIEPHEVASKTQLFTERYMVEWLLQNSLGQMWLATCKRNGWMPEVEAHGVLDALEERRAEWRTKREAGEVELDELMPIHSEVEERWKYWVPQPLPDEAVETAPESVWDIEILDPACGSGHFLVIAFDLLWALYQEEARHKGESWSDAAILDSIFGTNLHGIDIDPRAVQIAAASLYLKARTTRPDYHPKTMNLVAPDLPLARLPDDDPALVEFRQAVERETGIPGELTDTILAALEQAYHLGSLLKIDQAIEEAIERYKSDQPDLFDQRPKAELGDEASSPHAAVLARLEDFLAAHTSSHDLGLRLHGEQLAQGIRFLRMNREGRYELVVANPPYSGSSNLKEADYVKKRYPRGKADLFAAFLERGLQLVCAGGTSAMVTMRNWMFLKTYEDLRAHLSTSHHLRALNDLGTGAFAEISGHVVSTALSIVDRISNAEKEGVALQSDDTEGESSNRTTRKIAGVLAHIGRHEFDAHQLLQIEGQPLVYWWPSGFLEDYLHAPKLSEVAETRKGICTCNDTRYTRLVWEISANRLFRARVTGRARSYLPNFLRSGADWSPTVMGGEGRAWIEPLLDVLWWKSNGAELKVDLQASYGSISKRAQSQDKYFVPGVAFSMIGNDFKARVHRFVSIFGNKGSSVFPTDLVGTVCLMNASLARDVMESLNPGVGFEVGDVDRLPAIKLDAADEIFARLDEAFTEHEAARETSVEFRKPGRSAWEYAQGWAQAAVDRPEGEPLPPYTPDHEEAPGENWISWAIGVALGRFDEAGERGWLDQAPAEALAHGILYVSATDGDDSLSHPACELLHRMWDEHGDEVGRKKDDLRSWLREKFFKDVHRQMYDNAPIYFPLSSEQKTFVAHINIHRWDEHTLRRLLADHLVPERNRLEGLLADLNKARASQDDDTRRRAEDQYADVNGWLEELTQFIGDVEQCAEKGPPSTGKGCPARERDARYAPDLDDGTMINAAALWPLLDPQWSKYPKKWWKRLANEKGYRGKHFDWSKLAARYWPTRVDEKCQDDPSLAVAHGCFWRYHPERAYEWELRLQDEIHPNFTIDEDGSDEARQRLFVEHPDTVQELRAAELTRRQRNEDDAGTVVAVVGPEEHPTSGDTVPSPESEGTSASEDSGPQPLDLEERQRVRRRSLQQTVELFRQELGLPLKELSRRSGVPMAWFASVEPGALTADQLYDVAEALDVTVNALETGVREIDNDFSPSDAAAMAARHLRDD